MYRVLASIAERHDPSLLAVAALVCAFAAYAALSLHGCEVAAAGRTRAWWLVAAAIVTGSGIWATHFVAMLAFDPGVSVEYHWRETVLSIAIALTGMGLALAAYRPHLAAGSGIVVGAGIGAMHFVGMAAMHGPAHAAYDTGYVAVAFAFGAGFGAAALWTASRTRNEWRRALAAWRGATRVPASACRSPSSSSKRMAARSR